jgi:hypothetical protein
MNGLGELDAVTGADPGQPEPLISKAELGKDLFEKLDPPPSLEISVNIMAVSGVTSTDKDCIGPLKQSLDHIFGINHAGTHDPNQPHIGRISQSGSSGQIRSSVRAPVANKSNDRGFEVNHDLLSLRPLQNVIFCPIFASGSNFNPRNTQCMSVVKIFAFLELEKNEHFFKGLWFYVQCL